MAELSFFVLIILAAGVSSQSTTETTTYVQSTPKTADVQSTCKTTTTDVQSSSKTTTTDVQSTTITTTDFPETPTTELFKPTKEGFCKVPLEPLPHSRFVPKNPPSLEPGQAFDDLTLEVVCDHGYGIKSGRTLVHCHMGFWGWDFFGKPVCKRYCKLSQDASIEYRCLVKPLGPKCYRYFAGGTIRQVPCPIPEGGDKGYRICKDFEPPGTKVKPICMNEGNTTEELQIMTCNAGVWDIEPVCNDRSSMATIVYKLLSLFVPTFG